MKALYFEQIGDLNNLKSNLITCLQIEPSIEQIRIKLYQVRTNIVHLIREHIFLHINKNFLKIF